MGNWTPWYRVVKYCGADHKRYVYDQSTRRVDDRTQTRNRYLGVLGEPMVRRSFAAGQQVLAYVSMPTNPPEQSESERREELRREIGRTRLRQWNREFAEKGGLEKFESLQNAGSYAADEIANALGLQARSLRLEGLRGVDLMLCLAELGHEPDVEKQEDIGAQFLEKLTRYRQWEGMWAVGVPVEELERMAVEAGRQEEEEARKTLSTLSSTPSPEANESIPPPSVDAENDEAWFKPLTLAEGFRRIEKEGGFARMRSREAVNAWAARELGASLGLGEEYLYREAQRGVDLKKWLEKLDREEDVGKRMEIGTALMDELDVYRKRAARCEGCGQANLLSGVNLCPSCTGNWVQRGRPVRRRRGGTTKAELRALEKKRFRELVERRTATTAEPIVVTSSVDEGTSITRTPTEKRPKPTRLESGLKQMEREAAAGGVTSLKAVNAKAAQELASYYRELDADSLYEQAMLLRIDLKGYAKDAEFGWDGTLERLENRIRELAMEALRHKDRRRRR
jgi:hypothetical protein